MGPIILLLTVGFLSIYFPCFLGGKQGEDDEDMEQEQEPEEIKEKELEQLKAEKEDASATKQEDQKSNGDVNKIEMVTAAKLEKNGSSNGHSVDASKANLNGNSSEAASAKE